MDDLFFDTEDLLPTSTRHSLTDETIYAIVEEIRNENGLNVKYHMCVIVGSLCRNLHIVPVFVLPGIENAQEPHDLDLYRWVPFYRDVTTVDPEENMFVIILKAENVTYSFYHTSQRTGREMGEINEYVAALADPCDPWYGNILVVKTSNEGGPLVADIEEREISMIQHILSETLYDGNGIMID